MFFCSFWKALKFALCVLLLWRTKAQSSWQHLDYFDKIIFLPEPSREERSPFDNVVTHPSTWPCCIIILWASSLMIRPWNHTCVLWITEKHAKFFTHTDRHNHIIYICKCIYTAHGVIARPVSHESTCAQRRWMQGTGTAQDIHTLTPFL